MNDFTEYGDDECPDCEGSMSWCRICQQYSQGCCVKWGTCHCS